MIDSSISMPINIITKHLLCCICNMTVSGGEFLSASIDLYIKVINTSGDKCTSTNNDTRIRNAMIPDYKKEERPVECRLTR